MSAPLAAQTSRELVRLLMCFGHHDYPRPRGQLRALDAMRAELRRRERMPVAADRPLLGPVLCDPSEDPFCDEEDVR
jgi:hypothetical protein